MEHNSPRQATPDARPAYDDVRASYDRRTRAAYEVMGRRYRKFVAAKEAFVAATPRTAEWYLLAERKYRLGIRSTHAYYLWIRGHAHAAAPPALSAAVAEADARLRLVADA